MLTSCFPSMLNHFTAYNQLLFSISHSQDSDFHSILMTSRSRKMPKLTDKPCEEASPTSVRYKGIQTREGRKLSVPLLLKPLILLTPSQA